MQRISKKFLIILLILFAFALIVNISTVYAETNEISGTFVYDKNETEKVLNIVNQRRTENGLNPVSWDYDLERAAVQRAPEISAYFSHTRPDGRTCFSALDDIDVHSNYSMNGENIAYGFYTAESVMEAWMNSSGHRRNILTAGYDTMAVACVNGSWVQLFGKSSNNITINSQRYISFDNQSLSEKMVVSDLYVDKNSNIVQMNVGNSSYISSYFVLRSSSNSYFRMRLTSNLDATLSTNNPSAITFADNKFFTLNDYEQYTITATVADKSGTITVVGKKPDMNPYLFDAKYYADKYADLKNTFGYNAIGLRQHWETFGIKEGRQASPVFDPVYYLNNNSDLKAAFGNNYLAAKEHFVTFGIGELRKSSAEYWGEYYRKNNGDLANFSGYKLVMHYYTHGYNEERKANEGNVVKPVPQTPITQPAWNGNIQNIVFNASYYGDIYPDLREAFGNNEQALYHHWITFGIKEGRMGSPVFDPIYYLNHNQDLKNAYGNNYVAALEHYQTFGMKEGRKASVFFDAREYLEKYSDLRNAFGNDYARSTEHFLLFGIKEGRVGSSTFHVTNYRRNYADLNNAFGNNFIKYYNHYITFGIKEGRNGI